MVEKLKKTLTKDDTIQYCTYQINPLKCPPRIPEHVSGQAVLSLQPCLPRFLKHISGRCNQPVDVLGWCQSFVPLDEVPTERQLLSANYCNRKGELDKYRVTLGNPGEDFLKHILQQNFGFRLTMHYKNKSTSKAR